MLSKAYETTREIPVKKIIPVDWPSDSLLLVKRQWVFLLRGQVCCIGGLG